MTSDEKIAVSINRVKRDDFFITNYLFGKAFNGLKKDFIVTGLKHS